MTLGRSRPGICPACWWPSLPSVIYSTSHLSQLPTKVHCPPSSASPPVLVCTRGTLLLSDLASVPLLILLGYCKMKGSHARCWGSCQMFGSLTGLAYQREMVGVSNNPVGGHLNPLHLAPPLPTAGAQGTQLPIPTQTQTGWPLGPLEAIRSLCSKLCWGKGLCQEGDQARRSALLTNSGSVGWGQCSQRSREHFGVNQMRTPRGSSGVGSTRDRGL